MIYDGSEDVKLAYKQGYADAKVAVLEENARLREALNQIAEVPHDYPGDAYWFMRKTAEGAISSTKEAK